MAVRVAGCTASADPQHDLAEDAPGLHGFLCLCRLRQRELRGDGHLELHRLDGTAEALELLRPRDCVVANDRDASARLGFGLDSRPIPLPFTLSPASSLASPWLACARRSARTCW